jgi:hypothetical protein
LPAPLIAPLLALLLAPLPLPAPLPATLPAPLSVESLTLIGCKKIELELLTLLTSHLSKTSHLSNYGKLISTGLENTWDDVSLECHVSLGAWVVGWVEENHYADLLLVAGCDDVFP